MIPHPRHETRTVEQRRAYYRERYELQKEAKRREAEPTWWVGLDEPHFYAEVHAREAIREALWSVNYQRKDVA